MRRPLTENIASEYKYFKELASYDRKLYFGSSYGETTFHSQEYPNAQGKVYIQLSKKNEKELINLAVIKIKIESDFVSYKLNKCIVFLHDYKIISDNDYNKYIYSTTDESKIKLSKYGLSIHLISKLIDDGQLENIRIDSFNRLNGNDEFAQYLDSVNDFYKFELNKYIY